MIKKNLILGVLIGLAANITGIILYVLMFSDFGILTTLKAAQKNNFLGSLIALGAVLNLLTFFILLKKNRPYMARGVLLATLLAALCIVFSKFGQ